MRPLNIDKNIDLKVLVKMTPQATGADIKAICTEAGMFTIRRDGDIITREDFIKAVSKITKKEKESPYSTNFFI